MSDDVPAFSTLSHDDIRRWAAARSVVESTITSLREAESGEDVAALIEALHLATARARDHESAAIHLMKRYGFADGVEVPGIGRFRVHWMDDGTKVLERVL